MNFRIVLVWAVFSARHFYLGACMGMIKRNGSEMSYVNISMTNCYKLDRDQVQPIIGITLPDCIVECGLRQHCMALSYHSQISRCLLLRNTTTELNTESKQCMFILKSDMIIHQTPCGQECDYDMACDSVSRTCKYKECEFPRPVNADVLGNMASVGSKLRYKCNKGRTNLNDTYTAICLDTGMWSYEPECYGIARNCDITYQLGNIDSGVYWLNTVSGESFNVWCDMSSDTNNGWIVIQRRVNASDFYRTWEEYKHGFGDLNGNFWLGNENIWTLTKTGSWMLRFDLTFEGETGYAEYSFFSIGDETTDYVLSLDQYVDGNIGDSFSNHKGNPFSTKDRENDYHATLFCAQRFTGAWWYAACHESNLNGDYGNVNYGQGLTWKTWKGLYASMTTTEMKIREIVT